MTISTMESQTWLHAAVSAGRHHSLEYTENIATIVRNAYYLGRYSGTAKISKLLYGASGMNSGCERRSPSQGRGS